MERQKPTERKHILQNAQASPRKEPNPIAEGNIFKLRSHGSQDRTHDPQVEIRFSDQFIAEVIKRLLIEPHEIFLFKRKLYHPSAAHDGHDGELDEIRYGALCAVWMNIDIVGRRLPRSLALRAAREMLRTDSLSIEEWIKRNDAEQIWKVVHGLEHKTKELLPYYREVESAFGTDIADQTIDMAEAFKFLMKNIELRSN
ncbi:MAG: hypothetical protein QW112_03830, partial [Candidatus Micrarchaeia archaeon]